MARTRVRLQPVSKAGGDTKSSVSENALTYYPLEGCTCSLPFAIAIVDVSPWAAVY